MHVADHAVGKTISVFKPCFMVPAFLRILISSLLQLRRRRVVAAVLVPFSGRSPAHPYLDSRLQRGVAVSFILLIKFERLQDSALNYISTTKP
mgnify:CR=1 FL=1